jgi:fumarate hydratase subunit alpha
LNLPEELEPGMRNINTEVVTKNIKKMCIEANYKLASDVEDRVRGAAEKENSQLGKQILGQLSENLDIAAADNIPICQDTGMAIIL